jgi:hypothetical protein
LNISTPANFETGSRVELPLKHGFEVAIVWLSMSAPVSVKAAPVSLFEKSLILAQV